MVNIGYLKGIKCPKCGESSSFTIDAETTFWFTDDDYEINYDPTFTNDTHIYCRCGHEGTVGEFKEDK